VYYQVYRNQRALHAEESTPLTGGSRMLPGKSWVEVKISQLVFILEQFELTKNLPSGGNSFKDFPDKT